MVGIPMSIASFNYFLRAESSSADEYRLSHHVDSLEQALKSSYGQQKTSHVLCLSSSHAGYTHITECS